jgi:toxin CcdB
VLDLQADLIDTGSSVVAPLVGVAAGPRIIRRLEPVFEVHGEDHALHTAEMAAIPSALLLGQPIADLSGSDHEIRDALDMVFSGF